jgi:hypothetical protein
MTRERNILATILTVGLGALLVDRMVQGGGEPAAADAALSVAVQPAVVASLNTPAAPTSSNAVSSPPQGPSVAQRLARTAEHLAIDPATVREAFSPPASWLPAAGPAARASAAAPSAQAGQFAQSHQLEAVVLSGGGSFVVVGGRTIYKGQSLDGLVLVEIQSRAAVFESPQMRVVLRLSSDAAEEDGR